jgi:hypothetical protein
MSPDWDFPISFKALKHNRYEGWFYGAGVSYGYQWVMSKHWNLEGNIGAGYARIHYSTSTLARSVVRS